MLVVHREGVSLDLPEGAEGVPVPLPHGGARRAAWEQLRLKRRLRELAPDVVIWPNESVPRNPPGAMIVIAQNLVYHCEHIRPVSGAGAVAALRSRVQFAYYRRQMPRVYRAADAVVAVSQQAADLLAERAGLSRAKTSIAPPGVDSSPVGERAEHRPRQLLLLGALAPYKRIEVAIDAAAALVRAGGSYEVLCAGPAWPGYGEKLDRHAAAAGLGDRWRRVGAVDDPAALYAGAHVLVALSACESFGLPGIEAMRAGLPVVAADEAWAREMLADGARLVAPTPAAVATAVSELVEPATTASLVEAGRVQAARYTWGSMADAVADACRAVL